MCGEKIEFTGIYTEHEGSPPRVRGKDGAGHVAVIEARITPACAGKSPAAITVTVQ